MVSVISIFKFPRERIINLNLDHVPLQGQLWSQDKITLHNMTVKDYMNELVTLFLLISASHYFGCKEQNIVTKSQFIFLTRTSEIGCSRVSGSLMAEFCIGSSALFPVSLWLPDNAAAPSIVL